MIAKEKERGRQLLATIREGMEVVDSDGTRIGTVARVEGGHLKIFRIDQRPRNAHQFVSPELIHSVDERVRLSEAGTSSAGYGRTTSSPSTTTCGRAFESGKRSICGPD